MESKVYKYESAACTACGVEYNAMFQIDIRQIEFKERPRPERDYWRQSVRKRQYYCLMCWGAALDASQAQGAKHKAAGGTIAGSYKNETKAPEIEP